MGYRYDWKAAAPIKQIDVKKNAGGWLQVVIYAPETVDDKLSTLPQYLAKHGFICYLDEVEDKSVLKVADFGKEDQLFDTLRSGGFVIGDPTKTEIPDEVPKLSAIANIRKNSMNISGILGEIGHMTMIVLGWLTPIKDPKDPANERKHDVKRMAVGAFYGTATALPAVFGTGAGAIRFSQIATGLRGYLAKEGYILADPLITTPEIQFRERSVLTRLWDTLKSHPVQAQNLIALPGNILLTIVGINERRKNKGATGSGYIVSGTLAAISALIAIVVPEATPEQLEAFKKKKGFMKTLRENGVGAAIKIIPDSVYMFIARKPLAVYGTLLALDNGLGIDREAYQTIKHYQDKKNTGETEGKLYFPALTTLIAGAWSSSSIVGTLGSKNRDKSFETKEAYDGLYAQTANLILGAPKNVQDQIIKKAAEFLAAEPDVHIRASEIEKELTDKVLSLRKNPWTASVIATEKAAEGANIACGGSIIDKAPVSPTDAYVLTGTNQAELFANDPRNASKPGNTARSNASSPNPVLNSATAGSNLEQHPARV